MTALSILSAKRRRPMSDDQIKHMVNRFLSWKLPADFRPDCGITFDADAAKKLNPRNVRYEPIGTNLFTYTEAEAMVRHMLEGLPTPAADPERVEAVARIIGSYVVYDDHGGPDTEVLADRIGGDHDESTRRVEELAAAIDALYAERIEELEVRATMAEDERDRKAVGAKHWFHACEAAEARAQAAEGERDEANRQRCLLADRALEQAQRADAAEALVAEAGEALGALIDGLYDREDSERADALFEIALSVYHKITERGE